MAIFIMYTLKKFKFGYHQSIEFGVLTLLNCLLFSSVSFICVVLTFCFFSIFAGPIFHSLNDKFHSEK